MEFVMPVDWEKLNPICRAGKPCSTEMFASDFLPKFSKSIHHLSNRAELDVARSPNTMDNKAEVVNLHLVGKISGRFRRQEYQVVLQDLGEQREVSAPDPLEVEPDPSRPRPQP